MGKKSSAKKKRKDPSNPKEDSQVKESAGSRITMRHFLVFFLTVAITATVIIGGELAWKILNRAPPIAKYLPADKIMMVGELDTDWESTEWKRFFRQFGQNQEYWIKKLEVMTGLNFKEQIRPWLGRKIGVATLKNGSPIFFFETRNRKNAKIFLEQLKLKSIQEDIRKEKYRGEEIYSFEIGNGAFMVFFGRYLAIVPEKELAEEMIAIKKDPSKSLARSESYEKITENLPSSSQAFGYINGKILLQQAIGKTFGTDSILNILHPVLQKFEAQGFTAKMLENAVAVESMMVFTHEAGTQQFVQKYRAELADFAEKDPDFFYGSQNLHIHYTQFSKVLTRQIVDVFLNTELQKYFGKEIIAKEFLDLFEEEFFIAKKDGMHQWAMKLKNPKEQEKIIIKALHGFKKARGIFPSQDENGVLSGTAEQITEKKTTYKNLSIRAMEIQGQDAGVITAPLKGIYYTAAGNNAFFAETETMLQRMIDRWLDEKDKFIFPRNILQTSDEILLIRKKLLPEKIREWVGDAGRIMAGWSYHQDGVKSVILIEP